MVIVPTLLMIFLLTSWTGTSLLRSTSDLKVSEMSVRLNQALHVAEAGLDHALAELSRGSIQWNEELRGPDTLPGTADDGLLSFGPTVPFLPGDYAVRVLDNADEPSGPDDPATDVDGVVRVESTGTVQGAQRQIAAYVWSSFNHAVAAAVDIILREASAMGNIHANRNIEVEATSTLLGNSQATASGFFIFSGGETLIYSEGDLVGGDQLIRFLEPDAAALEAAVTRWNPPNRNGTILLLDQEVAGYQLGQDLTPKTISLIGAATLVVFEGHSITFEDRIGTFNEAGNCVGSVNVNIIALDGGSITFDERVCINGLIWAEGPVNLAERSVIAGAVVSAASSVTIDEKSQVTFDRSVLDSGLLEGFWSATMLTWQEL